MSKKYELVLIFDENLNEKQAQEKFETLCEKIAAAGGKKTREDFWGKMRLAYKIKNYESGFYFLVEFDFPAKKIQEFEKEILLDAEIIRHLLTIVSKNSTSEKFQKIEKKSKYARRKMPAKKTSKKTSDDKIDEKLDKILSDDLGI